MSSEDRMFDKPLNRKNRLDRFVKSKLDILDLQSPPINGWNRENTWQSIRKQLSTTNKNVVAWGLAMAASMSLVVAASINLSTDIFFDIMKDTSAISMISDTMDGTKSYNDPITNRPERINEVEKVKNIESTESISNQFQPIFIPTQAIDNGTGDTYSNNSIAHKAIAKVTPLLDLNYNVSSSGPGIGFGIDFNLHSRTKGRIQQDLDLGISTRIQRISTEQGDKLRPLAFLNLEYSRQNVHTQKGWSVRTGILLNKGGSQFQKNTLKFSVTRQFNKRIKAGPEVIFTNNFAKAYPGVSIVFS